MDVPSRLPNGRLLVPQRFVFADGTIGDGVAEIGPQDPQYESWKRTIDKREEASRATKERGK